LDLRIWFGGQHSPTKKLEILMGKRVVKCNVGALLEGRRLGLGGKRRLTLGKMCEAQHTNPSQQEYSNTDPHPHPVSQG
jgi:hypothetical protein